MHALNGNPDTLTRQINIIQINSLNSNFCTKLGKLAVTIHENKADLVIISESNMEVTDLEKMLEREIKLPEFNFEDKLILPNTKARVTMIIKKTSSTKDSQSLKTPKTQYSQY